MTATGTRKTADERREQILAAALDEVACRGFHGASTDVIARKAGLSQPYLFRLFGTKKELFVAVVEQCLDETHELFRVAAKGLHGEEAMHAIGDSYAEMLQTSPMRLRAQMQGYAACDDPEIREVMRRGYGRLVELVENVSGRSAAEISNFFAAGMLMNVVTMMNLAAEPTSWGDRLIEGCRKENPEV
jgi:AcrR family transcriptional regulator